MGTVYSTLQDFESSLSWHLKGLHVLEVLRVSSPLYYKIASEVKDVLIELGRFEEAKVYQAKAQKVEWFSQLNPLLSMA